MKSGMSVQQRPATGACPPRAGLEMPRSTNLIALTGAVVLDASPEPGTPR